MKCKKQVILMLSANSWHGQRLALDREARAIQSEIDRSRYRDQFELQTLWAAEPLDMLTGLRRFSPSIVHFSGHGIQPTAGAPADRTVQRDIGSSVQGNHLVGLCFQRPDGGVEVVSPAALKDTFRAVGASVRLVVLNACHSELEARALRAHIDCVIWMRGKIQDDAAIHFSTGLYGGIAGGASVVSAFDQGVAALRLKGLDGRPQLLVRPGRGPDPVRPLTGRR
jgi:CHAT domain